MTFLPIVGRELRVRARQWPTYWVRVLVGVFATLGCVQKEGGHGGTMGSPVLKIERMEKANA